MRERCLGSSVTRLGDLFDFGQLFKAWQQFNLPESHTFLGNLCKGVKTFNFWSEIIFGQLLLTFGDFLRSHCTIVWERFFRGGPHQPNCQTNLVIVLLALALIVFHFISLALGLIWVFISFYSRTHLEDKTQNVLWAFKVVSKLSNRPFCDRVQA